ncbi:hypothetical protein DRN38_00045 [Thermococci archaeon]|nr:MAG: hypothetical protein DRN38_00045 [Thermococci archaeon]
MDKKKICFIIILAVLGMLVGVPSVVALANGVPELFEYYVKALEYGLKGLSEYFKFIIDLFKVIVGL